MVSMSKWLVGSSRIRKLGLSTQHCKCHSRLLTSREGLNLLDCHVPCHSKLTQHTSVIFNLESWEFFLHDLDRTDGHVQLVHKVLSEVAKLEVPVGGPGALGRLVTLHLHHHFEQSCLSRTVF